MKQVILVREDLKMPKGKMAAQCAHAAVDATLYSDSDIVDEWRSEGAMKVVLKVKDLDELLEYHRKAKRGKFTTAMIKDAGRTVFKTPTITCLAIGPDDDNKLDLLIGKLKLM